MSQKLITVRDIIKRFNISFQTVNHYTNFGLLDVITKKGNVRMYDEDQVKERLARILKLISDGYSLRLIRKELIGI